MPKYDLNRVILYLHRLFFALSLCLLCAPAACLLCTASLSFHCQTLLIGSSPWDIPATDQSLRGKKSEYSFPAFPCFSSVFCNTVGPPYPQVPHIFLWIQRTNWKGLEHPQILVSIGDPGTNPTWIGGKTVYTWKIRAPTKSSAKRKFYSYKFQLLKIRKISNQHPNFTS